MRINGERMIRAVNEEFYYCDSRTILVEKHFNNWRGYVTYDKWQENAEIMVEGSFRQVVKELRDFFNKSVDNLNSTI